MDTSLQKRLTNKRWIILVASCLINLCIGSLYAWSVFSTPLAEKLNSITVIQGTGITAASLAIVFTVANAVGPVTMISGGYINDKLGPKWVIFVGGLLFGIGFFSCGFAKGIPTLLLCYGLGCGLGMGMVYGCTVSNSVKFFPDMRGLVGGITTATYGLSSVVIPPIANRLITKMGISTTFKAMGVLFVVVICACGMLIEACPEGFQPVNEKKKKKETVTAVSINKREMNWKEMMRVPEFYVMLLILVCGAFSGLMITSQASPMAQKMAGMSVSMAATAVSVLALFNASGRVIAGFLSDKIGRINVLRVAFVLEIVGLLLLINVREGKSLMFLVSVSIMGICFGSLMGVYPGFTADQFGTKNSSVNYGIMFIGFALAGILGPTIASKIVSAYGSYTIAFYVAGAFALIGIAMTIVFQKITKIKK